MCVLVRVCAHMWSLSEEGSHYTNWATPDLPAHNSTVCVWQAHCLAVWWQQHALGLHPDSHGR